MIRGVVGVVWLVGSVAGAEAGRSCVVYQGTDPVHAVAFSPQGHLLVWPAERNVIRFEQLRPLQAPAALLVDELLRDLDSDRFATRQEAFLKLAAFGREIAVPLRRALQASSSSEVRARVQLLLDSFAPPGQGGHGDTIRALAFMPDGRTVVSVGKNQAVHYWNAARGRAVKAVPGHTQGLWSVATSPDGTLVASGGGDHTIRLWNAATGDQVAALSGHSSVIHALAFAPDGKTLASAGSFDNSVRLWDVWERRERGERARLEHAEAVLCLAFSRDGTRLATSGYGGVIWLWDTRTERIVYQIATGARTIRSLAYSPEGRELASGGDDNLVRVWDLAHGSVERRFAGHSATVQCVAFAPDGNAIASASLDASVRLWPLDRPDGEGGTR
jgi:WD40 repeat protein